MDKSFDWLAGDTSCKSPQYNTHWRRKQLCEFSDTQVKNLFFDSADGLQKGFVALAAGVFQSPILPVRTREERALHIAAHGDDYIHHRNIGQELTVLGSFHVYAVDLLHQSDSILVDLRFGFRTGGVAFKYIARQLLAQSFCDLASAGIVYADKGNLFHYNFSLALILQIIWVMVPIGQKLHQVRGLNRIFTIKPIMVDVSIRL